MKKLIKEINKISLGENELLWIQYDETLFCKKEIDEFVWQLKKGLPKTIGTKIVFASDKMKLTKIVVKDQTES